MWVMLFLRYYFNRWGQSKIMTIGVDGKAGGDFTLTPVIQEFYADPGNSGDRLQVCPHYPKENRK